MPKKGKKKAKGPEFETTGLYKVQTTSARVPTREAAVECYLQCSPRTGLRASSIARRANRAQQIDAFANSSHGLVGKAAALMICPFDFVFPHAPSLQTKYAGPLDSGPTTLSSLLLA